jgi:hypothetical protein
MSKRARNVILLIAIVQIVVIIGLLALPSVVQAIPGRYRVALSERNPFLSDIAEGVIGRVAPVATALPAPELTRDAPLVDISALLAIEPTATAQPLKPVEEQQVVSDNVSSTTDEQPEERATAVSTTVPTAVPTLAPTPTPAPTATLAPLPERVILDGLGVIRQTFNNCGPANLTQVLNFYDHDITQAQVASYLKPSTEDRNVSPWQIADYVNEQTHLSAVAFSGGTLEIVKRLVAAGFPTVVEKGYELPQSGWWGHYLSVFGYDDTLQEFYSQDSFLGPWDGSGRTDSYEEIDYFWQQFNYTFYVVYRPQDEAIVSSLLGPEMLDEFTMWNNAAGRADQETKADPENPFAWFNLGTSLTRLGQLTGSAEYYRGGAQAFDQAREIGLPPRMLWYQFRPYMAYWKVGRAEDVIALADATLATQGGRNVEETYWYKGHALLTQGDVAGARVAYQTALTVNENFYPAQISLNSIGG